MTQNNLGNALADQAGRTEGAAGAALLAEAAAAYRAALEVHTRAAHPVDWAMTQENLGLAFEAMGDRGGDGDDQAGRLRGGAGLLRRGAGGVRCGRDGVEPGEMRAQPGAGGGEARGRAVGGIMSTTVGRVHLAPGVPM